MVLQKHNKYIFDSTPFEPLYREIINKYEAILKTIEKHDLLFEDISYDEYLELKQQFWNDYIFPKHKEVYFEIFPDDNQIKDDPDKFKEGSSLIDYNLKMAIALCEWIKREGFFHLFEGEVYFIDPTDLSFVLTDGVPFRRYPPQYLGRLLERVAGDRTNDKKRIEKLTLWVSILAILAVILIWIFISKAIGR